MKSDGLLYLSYSPLLIKPTSCCATSDFPSHFFIVLGEVAIVEVAIVVVAIGREVAVDGGSGDGGSGGDVVVLFWLRVVFVLFLCCFGHVFFFVLFWSRVFLRVVLVTCCSRVALVLLPQFLFSFLLSRCCVALCLLSHSFQMGNNVHTTPSLFVIKPLVRLLLKEHAPY